MSKNYHDSNKLRYVKHNGHRAWPYHSESVDGAAIEDLFWRQVQTNPDFAVTVARTVWPQAVRMEGELLLTSNQSMSLWPKSCGAFVGQSYSGLFQLCGDGKDVKYIELGTQRPDKSGYYLGALVVKHTGWLPQNVVPNLLHAMGQKLAVSDRFRFNLKANHHQVLMGKALANEEVDTIVNMAYPVIYGLSTWTVYWYKTENGNVSHGVVYFYDSLGHVHKLTISAWQPDFPSVAKVVYDLLNIAPPYPLYALNEIVRHASEPYALVCGCEATVDYIGREHAWTHHWGPVTTYAAIEGTDWSKLKGKTPIIFPEATERGCREAFRLYAALVKHGFTPRFLARTRGNLPRVQEFAQDMGRLAFNNDECSLTEFAEHCQRVFGVQPPDGVLQKDISLASLPEPAVAPEVLMDGLLDTGEQMMLHAWRGVGKSLFVLLLALCFASGKSALNGRVCPSRKYRVLLLDGEMSAHSLKKRASRLCAGHGIPAEAIADVKVRSMIVEKKDLSLETDAGFAELEPDMFAADIIIVDSVFKFFPTAMSSDFTGAQRMLGLHEWCRKHGKTLILIDHEGKGRGTSFGTMGKEIALDVVLRLCHAKSPHVVEAHVQKVRDHAEPTGAYVKMRIEADNERITFQACEANKGGAALEVESSGLDGEAESRESPTERASALDQAIKQYVSEHPDAAQGEIGKALKDRGYRGRSSIHARIKALSEAGKLPGWQNRPETHKVAEQPPSEGDEN